MSAVPGSPATSEHSNERYPPKRGLGKAWTLVLQLQTLADFNLAVPSSDAYHAGNTASTIKQGVVKTYKCKRPGCPYQRKTVVDSLSVFECGEHVHSSDDNGSARGLSRQQAAWVDDCFDRGVAAAKAVCEQLRDRNKRCRELSEPEIPEPRLSKIRARISYRKRVNEKANADAYFNNLHFEREEVGCELAKGVLISCELQRY